MNINVLHLTHQNELVFSVGLSSLFAAEKTKENEQESHGEGSNMFLSVNSESVEFENLEVTDAEQQRRKTPDEVCGEQTRREHQFNSSDSWSLLTKTQMLLLKWEPIFLLKVSSVMFS